MVRIDRRSGNKIFGAWPGNDPKAEIIWEAFKPESEPRRSKFSNELPDEGLAENGAENKDIKTPQRGEQRGDSDFLQNQGGIY